MTAKRLSLAVLALTLIGGSGKGSFADDWPQFLGKSRNGISKETGLIDRIPDAGLKAKWSIDFGEGMAGIAILGDKVVSVFQNDKSQIVKCVGAEDGAKVWETAIAPRYENSMGHGPRATPTIHDGKVLVYTGEGNLVCLGLEKGEKQWSVKTSQRNSDKPAEYGMSSSPLVVGDEVIVQTSPGGKGFSVCGYSIGDGEFKWGTNAMPTGYSSPMVMKVGGKTQIVVFSGRSLFGVKPVAGKMLWEYPFETEYNCNTANPISLGENQVLISSGENHGSARLTIEPAGERFKVAEKWTSFGRDSVLRSEWQTPIYRDGYLYGFDNVGSAGPVTHLVCVDAATGKSVWEKKRFGKGNLIYADGKLIISTMKGELILVKANSEKYELLGKSKLLGQTRQAPALSNGHVFLRDNSKLVCVDLRKP